MSVNWCAVALSLVLSSSVFAVATPQAAQAATNEDCPPWERSAFLTSEPLLVNPGGKCLARFRFEFRLSSASEKLPEVCIFARIVGSEKDYGPFCTGGPNVYMALPGPVEWLWSSKPLKVYIKLCATASDCG